MSCQWSKKQIKYESKQEIKVKLANSGKESK